MRLFSETLSLTHALQTDALQSNEQAAHELMNYRRVATVAVIQSYLRETIAALINLPSDDTYRTNASRIRGVVFRLHDVLVISGNTISVGEFIAHQRYRCSYNSFCNSTCISRSTGLAPGSLIILFNSYGSVLRSYSSSMSCSAVYWIYLKLSVRTARYPI